MKKSRYRTGLTDDKGEPIFIYCYPDEDCIGRIEAEIMRYIRKYDHEPLMVLVPSPLYMNLVTLLKTTDKSAAVKNWDWKREYSVRFHGVVVVPYTGVVFQFVPDPRTVPRFAHENQNYFAQQIEEKFQ